ncbi:hypothetical protein QCA50_009651 [Cerrena zonata]|uniref:Cytochrome P450 n=1 Tax=Cerrena zonata TaxID=2478898 RepID=A0AAW0G1E9_9APHY
MVSLLSLTVLGVIVFWLVDRLRKIGSRESGLPPGPPTLPLIGNLNIFPTSRAHLKFTDWVRTYGDIYSLKVGPGTAVVISSPRRAKECFEQNSSTTSDRPAVYVGELAYQGIQLSLARYGPHWRNMRRATHRLLSKDASRAHVPIQQAEASQLMMDIIEDPKNLYGHVRRYSTSVILAAVFGVRCATSDNPFIAEFFETQRRFEHILRPGGAPPVDMIPILKYIPERWAPWKELCRDFRARQQKYFHRLQEKCVDRIAKDQRNGSFVEYLLEHGGDYEFDYEKTCYLGLSLIEAGADTTAMALQFFVLCMLAHPDVLAKAQREIDDVIGHDRSPQLDDLKDLPYVRAIINELHRYRPGSRTAIPHAATADTKVGGYLIPKGSVIFMNVWGMGRDPELFDDPERFWPERFLNSEFGTKPGADTTGFKDVPFSFGAGRRICPGMYLAINSIAINVMNMLWAFNFDLAKDQVTGLPIPVDADNTTDGILLTPKPFTCDITPRSGAKVEMIRSQTKAAQPIFDRFGHAGLEDVI